MTEEQGGPSPTINDIIFEKGFDVNLHGTKRRFANVDKLLEFLDDLTSAYQNKGPMLNAASTLKNQITSALQQSLGNENEFNSDTLRLSASGVAPLKELIEGSFSPQGQLFCPKSKIGQAIQQFKGPSVDSFINAFHYTANGHNGMVNAIPALRQQSSDTIHSLIHGISAARDIQIMESVTPAQEPALAVLIEQAEDHLAAHDDDILGMRGRAARLVHDLRTKRIPDVDRRLEQFLEDSEKRVEETIKEFKRHIAAHSAVEYWERKRTESARKAMYFIIFSGIFLALALVMEASLLRSIVDEESSIGLLLKTHADTLLAPVLILTAVGFIALPCVWITRFFMTNATASYKYSRHCEHTSMQIQTYLAMRKDKQIVDEQSDLIIEKIFSDYQDGSTTTSSDMPSIGALGILLKAVQGKNTQS